MKVLKQQITSFASTNLQTPYADWSSTTTYSQGDIRRYGNYTYKSMVNSNLNVIPSENTGKWLEWEVPNDFAALDLQSETETICDASTIISGTVYDLALTANVDGLETIAFGSVKGDTLTIVEKDSGALTLETTVKTISNGELDYAHTLHASAYTVEITVEELTGESYSSIGSLIGGVGESIGDTVYNPKVGLEMDITTKKNPSGTLDITVNSVEKPIDVNLAYASSDAKRIERYIESLVGGRYAFIIDENEASIYENLIRIAYVDDFTEVLQNPMTTFGTISLQEVL